MTSALLSNIDTLAHWRRELDLGVEQFAHLLADHDLLDAAAKVQVQTLRRRLADDRLVVAFVAEFSRGKSELINALFFTDSRRRVMPATPGRTTMCPVELAWDDAQPPSLSLLPMDSRIGGQPVALLREQPALWTVKPLPLKDVEAMAGVLEEVTRTRWVAKEHALELGLWHENTPDDNPPVNDAGLVEVPQWRHALLNVPHPLLRRGLVVIDTPGLNAIGAEPELTLGLLPSAHAAVFILAADTGVTRADLSVWRDHLGERAYERFVVLNKIDTLVDPLREPEDTEAHLQRQCEHVARTLDVPRSRVFPISARGALAARVMRDGEALAASRLPAFEQALLAQLMPQRGQVIGRMVSEAVGQLHQGAWRRLDERRRQTDEQLSELHGLRGKSMSRLQMMGSRIDAEAQEFEACTPRLGALRQVLVREVNAVLEGMGGETLKQAVQRMRSDSRASLLRLGAAKAFQQLGERLREVLLEADRKMGELAGMLSEHQRQLNADFGFTLEPVPKPSADTALAELQRIQNGYARHVGVMQIWRLAQPGFMEQFARLLHSRLRVLFDAYAQDIEQWLRSASTQMDDQLREHRKTLAQRREAHQRIRSAESDLEQSIEELQQQLAQHHKLAARLDDGSEALRRQAAAPPRMEAPEAPAVVAPPPPVPKLEATDIELDFVLDDDTGMVESARFPAVT